MNLPTVCGPTRRRVENRHGQSVSSRSDQEKNVASNFRLTSEKFSGRSDFVSSSLWRGYPCVRTEHCIIVGFLERLEEWFLNRIACTFRKIMEVRSPMYPFRWFQCVGLFRQTRMNFPSQHCGAPPVRRHTTRVPSSSYTGNQLYLTSFGNAQLERWSCQ